MSCVGQGGVIVGFCHFSENVAALGLCKCIVYKGVKPFNAFSANKLLWCTFLY